MALDKAYLRFGVNLAQGFVENQARVAEQAIQDKQKIIANAQIAEQAGYAAVNYKQQVAQMKDAELSNAVAAMVAESHAIVNSSMGIGSREEADLLIARESGKQVVANSSGKTELKVNYLNQRKALGAQKAKTDNQLRIPTSGILQQVVSAGGQTYFDALNSGLIN